MLKTEPQNIVTFSDGQYAVDIDKTSGPYVLAQAIGYTSWVADAREALEHSVLNGQTVQEAIDHLNEGASWAVFYEVDRSTAEFTGA